MITRLEKDTAAAALVEGLHAEAETPSATEGLDTAVAAMLARIKPASADEIRAHTLKTDILPTVERWGFDRRFLHEETNMHPRQRLTFDLMRQHMTGRGAIVALVGERGLGKTTICAQFAIETAWRNHEEARKAFGAPLIQSVIYRKAAKIIGRYKPLYADFGSIETAALFDSLDYLCRQQEFLVIDEVHDCEDMKFKHKILTDLIDRRYSTCRDTILIANQTGADFAASIGDSILSRLNEHGCILACSWPSYRVQP